VRRWADSKPTTPFFAFVHMWDVPSRNVTLPRESCVAGIGAPGFEGFYAPSPPLTSYGQDVGAGASLPTKRPGWSTIGAATDVQ
jgi:hypothetical protein